MSERKQVGGGGLDGGRADDPIEVRERSRVTAPEVSWALRALNRAIAAVDLELARRLDLRPLDYAAMDHLMGARDPVGPAELSTHLGISTGSATELVDRLEQSGHVHRRPHPRDRRRVVVAVTDDGVQQLLTELGPLFASIDELATRFTPDEQAAIARYLRAAAELINDYASGGHPPATSA